MQNQKDFYWLYSILETWFYVRFYQKKIRRNEILFINILKNFEILNFRSALIIRFDSVK